MLFQYFKQNKELVYVYITSLGSLPPTVAKLNYSLQVVTYNNINFLTAVNKGNIGSQHSCSPFCF